MSQDFKFEKLYMGKLIVYFGNSQMQQRRVRKIKYRSSIVLAFLLGSH